MMHYRKATLIAVLVALLLTASQAQARYGGFWRNGFDTKASWPEFQINIAYGNAALPRLQYHMAFMSGSIAGVGLAPTFEGAIYRELDQMIGALGSIRRVPDPPTITACYLNQNGVTVELENPAYNSRFNNLRFNLYHFTNPSAPPRIVKAFAYSNIITDPTPPVSGTGFYVASTTWSGRREPAGSPDPWWSLQMTGNTSSDLYQEFLIKARTGFTSDYSEPYVYNADPFPDTGGIDAIALNPLTGDVFISIPGTMEILQIENQGENYGSPKLYRSAGFIPPGQKGLAIDPAGRLFTDNAASDGSYGGRIFRFDPDGGKIFTGSINYFSQFLMFANPVAAGQMVMGEDLNLYVYDALSREVKQIPVNASYDANRRVGHGYYRYDSADTLSGNVLDLETKQSWNFGLPGTLNSHFLYILDNHTIKGLPYGLPGMTTGFSYDTVYLD